jgi:hypothetical protein
VSPLARRFLKTGIGFLLLGLVLGGVMLARRELGGRYPSAYLVSAHTHVVLVGFIMMMIMGVALWMFPRPERDDARYRPELAEAAYWLVAVGTAVRFTGELLRPEISARWLGWIVVAAGFGQLAGIGLFFYNLLPRIRSTRKE